MNGRLDPVRDALIGAARADADALTRAACEEADRTVAAARERAAQILGGARELGERDGRAAVAVQRMGVRRQGRALVLAARRQAYEQRRAAAREAVRRLGGEDGTRDALVRLAQRVLGPDVQVRDAPDGGIVAEHAGRRLDLSLDTVADQAVEASMNEHSGAA